MTCSVTLDGPQRQALLDRYRKDRAPEVRFRTHIQLLLADGHTWATVTTLLFVAPGPSTAGSCCEAIALVMLCEHEVEVRGETVRRRLHEGGLVYRRPRPTLGPTDEEREAKLDKLRELIAGLPSDETAVFQDEFDINTSPRNGSMWMVKGRQAKVETPGDNEKRYLSGSIHWRTGQVFLTEGRPRQGRDTALFLARLDDLRRRLRCYRKIHLAA